MSKIGVVIHGITGRMGDVARRALEQLNEQGGIRIGDECFQAVPIGLGRDLDRLTAYAKRYGLAHCFDNVDAAMDCARKINREYQVYHNCVPTGVKAEVLLDVLAKLDPTQTAVFMEKPLASDYRSGLSIVKALQQCRFFHGVVHDFLETPGIHEAIRLMPKIRPLTCQMTFGYEVGAGFSDNPEFRGQRPDFNWTLAGAGGGIILDMSHESYISRVLFGQTESLSCVARLLVPKRKSATSDEIIHCDVEDYCSIRRVHASGVVNNSTWSWFRRINSEFGPLEIQVDGELGSIVCGLYGLKIQWKESAPANLWKDSLAGKNIQWRDYWQYVDLPKRNPFAVELQRFIASFLQGLKYPLDAICALNILGEVEALYVSAAGGGCPIERGDFLRYPAEPPRGWQPERLQSAYGTLAR